VDVTAHGGSVSSDLSFMLVGYLAGGSGQLDGCVEDGAALGSAV
jgi:hypothetical protein